MEPTIDLLNIKYIHCIAHVSTVVEDVYVTPDDASSSVFFMLFPLFLLVPTYYIIFVCTYCLMW